MDDTLIEYGLDIPDEIDNTVSDPTLEQEILDTDELAVETPESAVEDEKVQEDTNEWVYPDFVPDELVLPESFKSPEEELKWYRDNYTKAIDVYKTDGFKKEIVDNYTDYLMQTEAEVDKLKALKEAIDGNPSAMIKAYFGKDLKDNNIKVSFNQEETQYYLANALAEEYGKDYLKHFDQEDATVPGTLSYKMLSFQRAKLQELEQLQTENQTKEPTPEEIQTQIEQTYDADFKDFLSKEEFTQFIETAKQYQYSVLDIYNMMNHEKLVEEAYNRGLSDSKAKPTVTQRPRRVHRNPQYGNPKDKLDTEPSYNPEGFDYLEAFYRGK